MSASLNWLGKKFRVYYLKVLQELAVYYWDQADYEQGISYFEKALLKEPYEESVYLEYMERLMKANLVLQAKKVSELYQKYIEKELGIPVQAKLQKKCFIPRKSLDAAGNHMPKPPPMKRGLGFFCASVAAPFPN